MTARREVLAALAAALATWTVSTGAQTTRHLPRIGILSATDLGQDREGLIKALREAGYVDSASATLLWRSADGKGSERLDELVTELARLKTDVIISMGSAPTLAAKKATSAIPIVFEVGDAIGAGFVQSLGRPGGNLTGISTQIADFAPKCLQLLTEVRPELTEVTAAHEFAQHRRRNAAPALRLRIQPVAAATFADLDAALAGVERSGSRAMVVLDREDDRVGAFAVKNRIVTLGLRQLGDHGLLLSYGVAGAQINRQLANYVDKILNGAKPADLPVQQPTKFDLVINLKTAKAIGIAVPQSLLLRADEVIQ